MSGETQSSAADAVLSAALGLLCAASFSALEGLESACAAELSRRRGASEPAAKRVCHTHEVAAVVGTPCNDAELENSPKPDASEPQVVGSQQPRETGQPVDTATKPQAIWEHGGQTLDTAQNPQAKPQVAGKRQRKETEQPACSVQESRAAGESQLEDTRKSVDSLKKSQANGKRQRGKTCKPLGRPKKPQAIGKRQREKTRQPVGRPKKAQVVGKRQRENTRKPVRAVKKSDAFGKNPSEKTRRPRGRPRKSQTTGKTQREKNGQFAGNAKEPQAVGEKLPKETRQSVGLLKRSQAVGEAQREEARQSGGSGKESQAVGGRQRDEASPSVGTVKEPQIAGERQPQETSQTSGSTAPSQQVALEGDGAAGKPQRSTRDTVQDTVSPDVVPDANATNLEEVSPVQAAKDISVASSAVEMQPKAEEPDDEGGSVPRLSDFREATSQEQAEFPHVVAAFHAFMLAHRANVSTQTRDCYAKSVRDLFRFDFKAPPEMATQAYLRAIKHTVEDAKVQKVHSSSLKYFAEFWSQRGEHPFIGAPDASEESVTGWQQLISRRDRVDPHSGDGSPEAREAEKLPEGWYVHTTQRRLLGYASPGGRFYPNKQQLDLRLGRLIPKLERLAMERNTPQKSQKNGETEDGTPEKVPPKPLSEVLGPPVEGDKQTADDRNLLPRVLATFARHLQEQPAPKQQRTRDNYVLSLFKLFSTTERSLAAIAEPRFAELVAASEESRRCHGVFATAVRHFCTFWREVGGYGGTFDQATRDHLNLVLCVKPLLVEISGVCGYNGHNGELCQRSRQRCETCGTVLRCSKHDEHSQADCKEVFWATHTTSGVRTRTMKDFFRKPSSSAVGGGPSDEALVEECSSKVN